MDNRREVALFVDLENIREGIRRVYGVELSPALLIDKARKYGPVNIARAYADFEPVPSSLLREMQVCGIAASDCAPHGGRSGAALDLLADLVETLLDRSGIPTLILASGDRALLRAVTMARNRFGKEVIITGVPGTVSADLIEAAGGNFDPLEVPGVERVTPEAAAADGGGEAAPEFGAPGSYGRRPAAPHVVRFDRARPVPVRPAAPERAERPARAERPERGGERLRPAYGRRATRTTRGGAPLETARPRLPQPDVEEEIGAEGEGGMPAWQRGKLAERAEAIQRMLAERRAAGEAVPPNALGVPAWQAGDVVEGTVKSVTDFGAFLDLGGVDALLHVSQMAWQHVRHPSQVVQVGERLSVKVLEVDESSGRVSVGLKQLTADPWLSAANKYEVGRHVHGRVSGVKEYGVFVELEPGIFGLLHISNIFPQPWGRHPSERYRLDQEVEVTVSKIDPEMRRLAFVLPGMPVGDAAMDEGAPAAERPADPPAPAGEPPAAHVDEEAAEAALRFREGAEEL